MLWVGLQYAIVVFPVYIHLDFYNEMLYYKPIKGHLLKSNICSDNCFAIMRRLHVFFTKTSELAHFTNSITEAEKIYWT